ncbi:phospholipid-transporting ATPase ABCA3-like [Bacillus rossius redtenbacheri]|uniref:phospholipid-transporting ATPase ABCA3-like n=1 Tax=Bacillus rossius redtenbacheri TaxID=93214 RepID=UPI002FDC9F6C
MAERQGRLRGWWGRMDSALERVKPPKTSSSLSAAARRTWLAVCFLPYKMAYAMQWLVSLLYDYFKSMRLFLPPRNRGYMYARVSGDGRRPGGWAKLPLLLWKNWTLARRRPRHTAVEVLAPVFLSSLLMLIRGLVEPVVHPEPAVYGPFSPAGLAGTVVPVFANATEYGGFVGYSPSGPVLDRIMNLTAQKLGLHAAPARSEAALLDFIRSQYGIMKLTLGVVVFDDSLVDAEELPRNIKVKIRLPGESRVPLRTMTVSGVANWKTNILFPLFEVAGPRDKNVTEGSYSPGYYQEGFLALQHAVSTSVAEQLSRGRPPPSIRLQRFPYPPYIDDPLLPALQAFASVVVMLSFSYTCVYIVKAVTLEKEHQLKETMKIMGLPNWLHWVAWFLENFALLSLSTALMVALVKIPWVSEPRLSVFTSTDASVLFVFMLLYASVTIAFCFMMSVFFSTANIAATVAGLGWFLSYSPYLLMTVKYHDMSLASKMAACLCSNTAMAYGMQIIMMHEGLGIGLHWSSIWKPAMPDDNFVFGHVMIMMVLDIITYLLVAVYVEAVYPGTYGVPKPWYFPLLPSYWCGSRQVVNNTDEEVMEMEFDDLASCDMFEKEPSNVHAGIRIKNLHKVYGRKVAVKNLTLNMFEGQVTVLLGHNGAGKTSTMSVLTGLTTPTSGTAIVGGCDVQAHVEGARASLGLCPQRNVLFPELTVREHVFFFSKLKGMAEEDIEEETSKYLQLLDLESKADVQSKALSGGQKRKLSVAIALCGDSKVVLLDEPSSGMDPAARRALWDLLRTEKRGRTVLLTTHFMDEADALGDRVAVLAGGELRCCGSPFFLKKKYGTGYHLVVVKGPDCDPHAVTGLLRRYLPGVDAGQSTASELSYLLDERQSAVFEPMLRELEDKQACLGVKSYGLALTTMEEIFMKVGKEQDMLPQNGNLCHENGADDFKMNMARHIPNGKAANDLKTDIADGLGGWMPTGARLALNQLRAVALKSALHAWRTGVLFLVQLLIPVVNISVTFLVVERWQSSRDLPPIELSPELYGEPLTPVALLSSSSDAAATYQLYKDLYPASLVDLNRGLPPGTAPNITRFMLAEAERHLMLVRQNYVVGATFAGGGGATRGPVLTGFFNNQPLHSPPISLGMLHNVALRWVAGENYSLSTVNHPLPYLQETKAGFQMTANNLGFQLAFNMTFAMCFVTAFYVMFPIKERASKSKHLQFVSGVGVLTYWSVQYLLDMLSFVLVTTAILITMLAFHEDGYHTPDQLGRYFVLFVSFGCGMLPLMYLASYFYMSPSTGFTRVVMWNAFTGVAGYLVVCILQLPDLALQGLADAADRLLVAVPLYSLGVSLRNMYTNYAVLDACRPLSAQCHVVRSPCCSVPEQCPDGKCIPMVQNYFDWNYPGVGRNICFFFVDGIIFTAILLLIEFRVFEMILYSTKSIGARNANFCDEEPEDSDVLEEQEKIRSTDIQILNKEYKLLMVDITKFYGNFPAVKRMCVGVKSGECFGLLGVNGAGKTSTFKMLTGDETISSGDAYVNGLNLKSHMKQVCQMIGYCPQFDALIEELTGRETLTIFSLLRGIPPSKIPDIIRHLTEKLLFTAHIDKKVSEYSGGNKRKLSTAVALVGDPAVVFLDEPTNGMDSMAKRHLWNIICDVRDSGKCIVLTSHSMEECEALCTRIAIMVNGRLKCLGSPQHLKSKFAEGYTLAVKMAAQERLCGRTFETESVKQFVQKSFPGAVLREQRECLMTFYLPAPTPAWSRMFGTMEYAKTRLDIEDYSLAQTSLEQVFLSFTKHQRLSD